MFLQHGNIFGSSFNYIGGDFDLKSYSKMSKSNIIVTKLYPHKNKVES